MEGREGCARSLLVISDLQWDPTGFVDIRVAHLEVVSIQVWTSPFKMAKNA